MIAHLGDITKIDGLNVPIVDCVIGGSPCQDLSVAGKRAGLAGKRSGLYMEQIRLVKEMREQDERNGRTDESIRPRYMVWENVPGAFSANKGKDFAAVIEEAIKIVEPEAPSIEVPEKGWPTWGGYHDGVAGRWSLAWRVLDAQYWGVPQRRRRIALVVDFGGDTAGEILFESESLSWNSDESGETREAAAEGIGNCTAETVYVLNDQGGSVMSVSQDVTSTLRAQEHGHQPIVCKNEIAKPHSYCILGNVVDRNAKCNGLGVLDDVAYTLNTVDRHVVCAGFKLGNSERARSIGYQVECAPTLNAQCGGNKPAILDMAHACDVIRECGDIVPTLNARMGTAGNQVPLTYAFGRPDTYTESDIASTESARQYKSATDIICGSDKSIRRLTPLECERLQGCPDGWTDIGDYIDSSGRKRRTSDSARYKALGNSIAIPPWTWVLNRICSNYDGAATMASLFDGIGGFPLIWERINGKGTCLWASEIEEFPMAVTRRHFK